MKHAFKLGKIAGIQVSVHWTFLILIAWIVFQNIRAGMDALAIVWSISFILSIFLCVTLHELGHALTAKRFHIKTRDITLYPIGGIARLESIPRKPREELLVALAGPAVNFLIAALLYPFIDPAGLQNLENLTQIDGSNFIFAFISVNLWLAIFNLIPAFPMDGGRVFRALLAFRMTQVKATLIAARLGQILAIGFIGMGFYINPFLVFIGIFIFLGAQAETTYTHAEVLMEGHTVLSVTMKDYPLLPGEATVGEAVTEMLNSEKKNFLIKENGAMAGTLSLMNVLKALREKSENCRVRDVMEKNVLFLQSSLPINEAIREMQRMNKSIAIVLKDNEPIGMVDNENLGEFILIQGAKQEFGKSG